MYFVMINFKINVKTCKVNINIKILIVNNINQTFTEKS